VAIAVVLRALRKLGRSAITATWLAMVILSIALAAAGVPESLVLLIGEVPGVAVRLSTLAQQGSLLGAS